MSARVDGFAAISTFTVRDGAEAVRQAFVDRPHLVDSDRGFRDMRVLCPADDPDTFWLMTFWDSEEDFDRWHASHDYKASHAGIPKGLRLVKGSASVQRFRQVAT